MIGLFFRDFIGNYQKNVVAESASHLVEISYQVSRYLEEKIDNDWKAARSIAGSITVQGPGEADNLFARMRRERSI